MNADNIVTLFITILIIIMLISRVQFHIINKQVIIHFIILLCIVILFYIQCEKSAFMMALLYLIAYVQSKNIKEYFSSPTTSIPEWKLPSREELAKLEVLLTDNHLTTQPRWWVAVESFDDKTRVWTDLVAGNNITFTAESGARLTTSNNTSGPKKWVSGNEPAWLSMAVSENTTLVHLSRYQPRSHPRGALFGQQNSQWVSGYDDNKFTFRNHDGTELTVQRGNKMDDIMNIRGSIWNLFIDRMKLTKNNEKDPDEKDKIRTVYVNGNDYVFEGNMSSLPPGIGLNTVGGKLSKWDCAEIIVYSRAIDETEVTKIIDYMNKKYLLNFPPKLSGGASDYNIYNHYTFGSTPASDWMSPPSVDATTSSGSGNTLLGITDSEYDCVSLCDKKRGSGCSAFSYHMEKGTCYQIDVSTNYNILNHTTQSSSILSGTNREKEETARKAKEEAERKAREEAERKRLEAIRRAAEIAERRAFIARNTSLLWFNKQRYVYLNPTSELNLSAGDFCIECWYYESSSTGNNTIIDKGNYNYLFQVRPNGTSSIGFYNNQTGWWYAPGGIPSRQWVHLAITYSKYNRTMTYYQNGNLVPTQAVWVGWSMQLRQNPIKFDRDFGYDGGGVNIGRQSPDSCSCNLLNNAVIFDLRLWNWFRSQNQIRDNMNIKINPTSKGLVANFMMTYRPSDLVIFDETGRNNGNAYTRSWWWWNWTETKLSYSRDMYLKITPPYSHEDIPNDTNRRCPEKYNSVVTNAAGDYRCYAGWSSDNQEWTARNNCINANGRWIPLNYSYSPYTCQMKEHEHTP